VKVDFGLVCFLRVLIRCAFSRSCLYRSTSGSYGRFWGDFGLKARSKLPVLFCWLDILKCLEVKVSFLKRINSAAGRMNMSSVIEM